MFSLFKKPEYKRFDLKPRYWDPEKEAKEERLKRIKAEIKAEEGDKEEYAPDIRSHFRKEYERRKASRGYGNFSYTLRLFMILIMLFLAAFLLFIKNPEGIMRFFGIY